MDVEDIPGKLYVTPLSHRASLLAANGVILLSAAVYVWGLFSVRDQGELVRIDVRRDAKHSSRRYIVDRAGDVHTMRGDPQFGGVGSASPGTYLLKVPGEFCIRAVPNWDRSREPGWFEFGYQGLAWLGLWWGLMLSIWCVISWKFCQEADFATMPGHIVIRTRIFPFPRHVLRQIPREHIIAIEQGVCSPRDPAHGVKLQINDMSSLDLGSFQDPAEASRLVSALERWWGKRRPTGETPPGSDVTIVMQSAAEPHRALDVVCQVCGSGRDAPWTVCASCETHHHLECWHYVGHCSVYGCPSEKRRDI